MKLNLFSFNLFKLLSKIDHYLLMRQPIIWATKIHYVGILGTIYLFLISLMAFFLPISTENVPNINLHFLLFVIPSSLFFFFWIYQLLTFKAEQEIEFISPPKRLLQQLIYFIIPIFFGICPLYYSSILSYRIANLAEKHTLLEDIKHIMTLSELLQMNDARFKNLEITILELSPQNAKEFEADLREVQAVTMPKANSTDVKKAIIVAGMTSLNKYCPLKIDIKTIENKEISLKEIEDINEFFNKKIDEFFSIKKCISNLTFIIKEKYNDPILGSATFFSFYLYVLVLLGLLFSILINIGFTNFTMAFLTTFFLLITAQIPYLIESYGIELNIYPISINIIISFLLLIASFAIRFKKTRFSAFYKIIFATSCIWIITAPISMYQNRVFEGLKDLHVSMIISTLLSWLLWALFFDKKIRDLAANPS